MSNLTMDLVLGPGCIHRATFAAQILLIWSKMEQFGNLYLVQGRSTFFEYSFFMMRVVCRSKQRARQWAAAHPKPFLMRLIWIQGIEMRSINIEAIVGLAL